MIREGQPDDRPLRLHHVSNCDDNSQDRGCVTETERWFVVETARAGREGTEAIDSNARKK